MEPDFRLVAAAVIAGMFLLILLCRPSDPNTELARTTREAVELAQGAQSGTESTALWAGRFRLLAVVAGVSVPLIMVYLIWRSSAERPRSGRGHRGSRAVRPARSSAQGVDTRQRAGPVEELTRSQEPV